MKVFRYAGFLIQHLACQAHRIELRGESMRKTRAKKSEGKSET
jgi:hypothetical protein